MRLDGNEHPLAFIDFEYRKSADPVMDLVSAVLQIGGDVYNFWLFQDRSEWERLAETLTALKDTHYICAYAALAESRCFKSLGLNPMEFSWIDLFSEFRQLTNHVDDYAYGRILTTRGSVVNSTSPIIRQQAQARRDAELSGNYVPSHFAEDFQDTGNYEKTSVGLAAAVFKMLGEKVDTEQKARVRGIIIHGTDDEVLAARNDILDYNSADIKYLERLQTKMRFAFCKQFLQRSRSDFYWVSAPQRGRFAAAMGVVEANGIPLDQEAIGSIVENTQPLLMSMWEKSNTAAGVNIFWPLEHKLNKKTGLPLKSSKLGVFGAKQFRELVTNLGLLESWPRTKTGALSTADKLIKKMSTAYPAFKALRDTRKLRRDLGWLSPTGSGKDTDNSFYRRIGSDGRIRSNFGIFGTQSGRNAAKASSFPFAMSSWIRSIIRHPNLSLTGADFSGQEVLIAATFGDDPNMLDTYNSKDVYLYFAKLTGAVPEEDWWDKKKYDSIRTVYKSVFLGINFGMAGESLAQNLTEVTGKPWTKESANGLIKQHKDAYPKYWQAKESFWTTYAASTGVQISADWFMGPDNPSKLSVLNCPVQGMGAAILREALIRCVEAGLHVISPLHDAIYILHSDEADVEKLKNLMHQAAIDTQQEFFGRTNTIRIDTKTVPAGGWYVEPKGKGMFEEFKHIITGS